MCFGYGTTNAQVTKILFLGNSYTGVNNLPQLIKDVALSFGDTIFSDQNIPGGYYYAAHTTNATSLSKIQAQDWDFVVLQEQSQIPSLTPAIVGSDYSVPHSITLNNLIKANNSCTETVFYMTWGRKNGDASFCAQHPPVCTYAGMQQELRNTYMLMADTNKATVAPVGVAWQTLRDSFPLIELYNPDESHPSLHGSYLAACVFYSTLYQKSCIGSTYMPIGIGTGDAVMIQTIATNTVLDSLDLWRIGANLPIANFNYSGGGTINFTNTSTNGVTYFWDFGDGNTSTQQNPNNTYAASNSYTVQLIAYSLDSCFSDTITQNINVNITGIDDLASQEEVKIYPNPANDFIQIETSLNLISIVIMDATGKIIRNLSGKTKIDISKLSRGVYFIKIIGEENIITQKFIKQ